MTTERRTQNVTECLYSLYARFNVTNRQACRNIVHNTAKENSSIFSGIQMH